MKPIFILIFCQITFSLYGQVKYEFPNNPKDFIPLKVKIVTDKDCQCKKNDSLLFIITRHGHSNQMDIKQYIQFKKTEITLKLHPSDDITLYYGDFCQSEKYSVPEIIASKDSVTIFHLQKTKNYDNPNARKKILNYLMHNPNAFVGEWINHWETPKREFGILYQNDTLSIQKRFGRHLIFSKDGTFTDQYYAPCGNDNNIHKYVGRWFLDLANDRIIITNLKEIFNKSSKESSFRDDKFYLSIKETGQFRILEIKPNEILFDLYDNYEEKIEEKK